MKTTIATIFAVLLTCTASWGQCTTVLPAPATENFDVNAARGTSSPACGNVTPTNNGTYPAGWTLDPSSTTGWGVFNGSTSSTATGPSGDNTTGGGNYLFIETSGTCPGTSTAVLVSPCFDVSALPNSPVVEFFYHMWGADIGTLSIEGFDGTNWNTVFSLSGDQGDAWVRADAALPTFNDGSGPRAQFRIRGTHSGTGFEGDMAIDDISLTDGLAEWNVNSNAFSMTADGVTSGGLTPAITPVEVFLCTPPVPTDVSLEISSDMPGAPYDIAISTQPLVGGVNGGFALPGGQFVNVDLASPLIFASSGSPVPGSATLPFSFLPGVSEVSIEHTLSFLNAANFSLQGFVVDASAAAGLTLSQGCQVDVTVQPALMSVAGPTTTTANVTVDVTATPTCWAPTGIDFYGTNFTQINVSSNGYISFGGVDTDTSPSILDAMNDDGRFGFWTNFDPSEGGTVTISSPSPTIIRVDYAGVFYDAGGPGSTFFLEIDSLTGALTIGDLQMMLPNPNTTSTLDDQWMGVSSGLLGGIAGATTDGGAAPFSLGGTGGPVAQTDMLYEFNDVSVTTNGLPASVNGGMNTLQFFPDGSGNYTWAGF